MMGGGGVPPTHVAGEVPTPYPTLPEEGGSPTPHLLGRGGTTPPSAGYVGHLHKDGMTYKEIAERIKVPYVTLMRRKGNKII